VLGGDNRLILQSSRFRAACRDCRLTPDVITRAHPGMTGSPTGYSAA
jgi:hypothetical protein